MRMLVAYDAVQIGLHRGYVIGCVLTQMAVSAPGLGSPNDAPDASAHPWENME